MGVCIEMVSVGIYPNSMNTPSIMVCIEIKLPGYANKNIGHTLYWVRIEIVLQVLSLSPQLYTLYEGVY